MRKNGKKALSLLLALVLVLGMLLGAAFAADSDFVIENGVLTDYHGPSGAVTIPNGVTSIGDHVFSGRTDLTSVTIPDGVTKIGFGAFYGCAGLTDVQVGAGNQKFTSIGGVLFSKDKKTIVVYPGGKKGAYTIPGGVTSIEWTAFGGCTGLTSVTIPSSVISIGQYALEGCTGLTSVTIPSSVTYIGDGAFSICTGLADIQVSAGNPEFTSIDGVLFSKDQKTIKAYPGGKKGAYTIPDNVTSIAGNAFESCEGLTGVTIPSSVTSIGDLAFQHCTGLTSVVIPNSVTSIEWSVFNLCAGLTSVTIPNSVTSIGWGAFGGCTGLTDVYYKGTEAQWQQISIDSYGNSRLTSATIHYNSTGPDGTEPSSPSSSKTSIKIDKYFYAPFGSETMLFFALETSAGHATEQLNSITWTSSNEKVFPSNPNPVGDVILSSEWTAQITGGLDAEDTTGDMAISATPKEVGTTTITIKTADGATAECTLTVTGGGNSVSMDSELYTIRVDNSGTVFADIKNSDQLDDISWTWKSSNNKVISLIGTVNQGTMFTGNGTPSVDLSASIKFKALSPGTATISCTLDSGATASRQIVVISKNDNQKPIDSNAYNRPSYEQTVSEKNLKELEKLGQQWETKYKKLVNQVDKVLKEGDKDPDVLMAAVQPDEELAR